MVVGKYRMIASKVKQRFIGEVIIDNSSKNNSCCNKEVVPSRVKREKSSPSTPISLHVAEIVTKLSPDGDVFHCVPSHLQPAFDHLLLKGHKPLDPPERPKGSNPVDEEIISLQRWTKSGKCPKGTIPIRRTTEADVLRASDIGRFGRKNKRIVRRDSIGSGHEHAVAFANGNQYYGAKASMNVWTPKVTDAYEFSLSQIWVVSSSFGNDLNTIEAG